MASETSVSRYGPILRAQGKDKSGYWNINGPSLIASPPWAAERLGRYYLYFAQHRGDSIWLAFSDDLSGEWRIAPRPVLTLDQTHYSDHIASPDVVLDEATQTVRMYFHGGGGAALEEQTESLALSNNGFDFKMATRDLGPPYWRVFRHNAWWFALIMPGQLARSSTGLKDFEIGQSILPDRTRHSGVAVYGDRAWMFYSQLGERPERIWYGSVALQGSWRNWNLEDTQPLLEPEEEYEGSHLQSRIAEPGQAVNPCREVRDPSVLVDSARIWLAYTGGGERCIALASIDHLTD